MPIQLEPDGDWSAWVELGGRGSGKTEGASRFVDREARKTPIRIAIIAPTIGDAVESCVNGPSGLKAINPTVRLVGGAGGLHVYWPNGSEAKLFGAFTPADVERLRAGGNRHLAWWEEWCAWAHLTECSDHSEFGLRLGEHPRKVISTTPKPLRPLRELLALPSTVVTRGTTVENPFLSAQRRAELYDRYAGTRLGRQELGAEILEDVEGALWQYGWIDAGRVTAAPDLARIVVAVDPAATHGEAADFTAVVSAGLGVDGDYYVLAADAYRLSPSAWATRAVDAYDELAADRIVAEVNNGGDMVVSTIRQVRRDVPVKVIHASRGKTVRAEPIAALYEQGRVHHVGTFAALVDQMCAFPVANEHDDLVDACVYALTELAEGGRRAWGLV